MVFHSLLRISAVLACLGPGRLPADPGAVQEPAWSGAPLFYGATEPVDAPSRLNKVLAAGTRSLRPNGEALRIEAVLEALGVPASSQVAIFSSASLQARRITPERPRTLYFSDEVYVGFVPGGRLIEVASLDASEGIVYYTLSRRSREPRFERETHRCLQCHAPTTSGGLPAHLLRSLHPKANGDPDFSAGSTYVDPSTPFEERWGGWYVTGDVAGVAHLGNQTLANDQKRLLPGAGRHHSLAGLCDTGPYPVNTSDVVAMLVLEHQTHVQNALAWAGYEARRALDYQVSLNEALELPPGTPVESVSSRLEAATERVIEALLGAGEAPLPEPLGKRSPFAAEFQEGAHRDPEGRSLKDLDLSTKVFRYPLSYTIDSSLVKGWPEPLRARVYGRLRELFCGALKPQDEARYGTLLPEETRKAVRAIVASTLADGLGKAFDD